MRVDEELKRKRAELLGEVEELKARIQAIDGQVSAIDQVIAIYDPAHVPRGSAATKPQRPRAAQQLPPEFARINKNEAILEVLREAEQPLSTADCTSRIAERNGADADDPSMPRFLTQVSAALIALTKRGRVRQAGTVDGRKHLWEIAA
ncbi:hypothetical protein ARD30_21695 [Bosea thiooxidans]|uniref:Uncharacterized protein n=1 Tax=Bosea thiooxidans TaxID=53254 RepID=A0A0Q3KF52_9HYPH|nr:hypothetical protein [Bosea thiooxidans]OJV05648.1 MAG: hypothetical protein BGO20_11345 [Bosea sp. 67-29]CAH1675224.1 conserved hypothetical protein [Hyphomicrobiales bacterium]KQK28443.1 hypothetical protein ARD30_21695 [Bosea thiooxidans]CAH1700023.1 conserved hypothetical protein [Hyphomicrobiales bacterium]CAI0343780.1 conserved hypothetical protein [Hyphomicrobiales bacterium]